METIFISRPLSERSGNCRSSNAWKVMYQLSRCSMGEERSVMIDRRTNCDQSCSLVQQVCVVVFQAEPLLCAGEMMCKFVQPHDWVHSVAAACRTAKGPCFWWCKWGPLSDDAVATEAAAVGSVDKDFLTRLRKRCRSLCAMNHSSNLTLYISSKVPATAS